MEIILREQEYHVHCEMLSLPKPTLTAVIQAPTEVFNKHDVCDILFRDLKPMISSLNHGAMKSMIDASPKHPLSISA